MFSTFTSSNASLSNTYDKPSFIPKFIPGCTLWFDANDPYGNGNIPSVNSELSQWVDKSGNRNHATAKTTAA